MALARTAAQLLQHVRFHVSVESLAVSQAAGRRGLELLQSRRGFAEGSTYLDKGQVTDRVLNIVKHFENVDTSKVSPTCEFQKDLGLDSLDTVELVMAMEEEFAIEIPDNEADKILSCTDAINYIASHPMAK